VFVEQWKSQWRAISDLARARVMRIPTALTWQCKIGIFWIRLERVSRTRSDPELLGKPNLNINHACPGVERERTRPCYYLASKKSDAPQNFSTKSPLPQRARENLPGNPAS
jgi:hypothetical protein